MKAITRRTIGLAAASSALLIGGAVAAPTASAGGGEEWVSGSSYALCKARLDAAIDRIQAWPNNTIDGVRPCMRGTSLWWGGVWW